MKVEKEWWKGFFDGTYLITDARSVGDPALTRRETDLIEDALGAGKDDSILDLCGGHGRHSLELAKRGYRRLTVLDCSEYLIRVGRRLAREAGADIRFVRADARSSGLEPGGYAAVFIMANSFGYSQDERENMRVLKEARRLLGRSGKIMLDIADAGYVKRNLVPLTWHEAGGDMVVCRERELDGALVKARELVISKKKGLVRDGRYCERLYGAREIRRLLKRAGFQRIFVRDRLSLHGKKADYGFLTSRLVVTATK